MAWLHVVIDVPVHHLGDTADYWGRVLGWPAGTPWPAHPELRSWEPPNGRAYVHLQHVDGDAGVHLDLESEEPDATVQRAVDLGARLVGEQDRWRTFHSPGGLPFCVVAAGPHDPPGPVTWPEGHRTRLVQVCIDSPRDVADHEVAFWRALLGERWVGSSAPEFSGKWHDDAGSPLQLLFQRLDDQRGQVRAHLDLGTDDLELEVRRHLELGATDVGAGRGGWHVLRDPIGQTYCVTANSPASTQHRDIG